MRTLTIAALVLLGLAAEVSAQTIPARPAGAPTGRQFLARTASLSRADREAAILRELSQGNVPLFERRFVEVAWVTTDAALRPHEVRIRVAPDYLAIGADADFVRMPMNPLTAQRLCDLFHCTLPTRRMVNRIYPAADVKLAPVPLTPGPQMMSNAYILTHEQRIETEWGTRPLGLLTGGDKKDVVISNLLLSHPGRVAIYGWHLLSGQPIQPLSTVHENLYADYSHGIRLVAETVLIDGRPRLVVDVLQDRVLASLLSDEGPMPSPRVPGVPHP